MLDFENITQTLRKQSSNLSYIKNLSSQFIDIKFKDLNLSIPFLPLESFKNFEIYGSKEKKVKTFLSSGSTGSNPSSHAFSKDGLELYSRESKKGFQNFLLRNNFKENVKIVSLVPHPSIWISSSLASMLSMFAEESEVIWCRDIEESIETVLETLDSLSPHDNVIIFGTTLHHVLFSREYKKQKKAIKKFFKNLIIVDTGGSKGRSHHYSIKELSHLFSDSYGTFSNYKLCSEYGMCELSSQAWASSITNHFNFVCNDSLKVFSVDLKKREVLPFQKTGFLAFFDACNTDSYSALLTEDIGMSYSYEEFSVFHRAMDASQKGCSLNVKETFYFFDGELKKKKLNKAIPFIKAPLSTLPIYLNKEVWKESSLSDLSYTLEGLDKREKSQDLNLESKKILIVSSANIPITWFYPVLIACDGRAESVTIKLPTIREEDPFSSLVKKQSAELARAFSSFVEKTEIFLSESNALYSNLSSYDLIIVFGTSLTMETFRKKIHGTQTKLLPMGDILNTLRVKTSLSSIEDLGAMCSLWFGRGCLTPVAFIMDECPNSDWKEKLLFSLYENFLRRIQEYDLDLSFFNELSYLKLEGLFHRHGLELTHLQRKDFAVVVDFSSLSLHKFLALNLDFSIGGCAIVFLINNEQFKSVKKLSESSPRPNISSLHNGKTWEKHFQSLFPS